jgi:hypothetical protein
VSSNSRSHSVQTALSLITAVAAWQTQLLGQKHLQILQPFALITLIYNSTMQLQYTPCLSEAVAFTDLHTNVLKEGEHL